MPSRAARSAPFSQGAAADPYSEGALSQDQFDTLVSSVAEKGLSEDEGDSVIDIEKGAVEDGGAPEEMGVVSDVGNGDSVVEFQDAPVPGAPAAAAHGDNLAEEMPEVELNKLASDIMAWVQNDRESRHEWETMLTEGIRFLGLKIEDREWPFPNASGVYDTTMLEAVIRWHAVSTSELLPAGGPVKTQIIGVPNEQTEQQSGRVKDFMNFYLTEGAPEYVEENDQMLMWLPLVGSTFKKTYQDPILNRPVSPFITPSDFIVSANTTDLETCARATHVIHMSQRDLKMRQLSNFYLDIPLSPPDETTVNTDSSNTIEKTVQSVEGIQPSQTQTGSGATDQRYELYESHIDLDLAGFEHTMDGTQTGLPLPYIVTVETHSRKILAIRRNWKEGDTTYQKVQYFTHFKFIPGLGFYGIGYAHILGNPAKAATGLQRQMMDAGTLEMFPGGLKVKGMRLEDNNLMIGPCEFREIDTGGMPINQAITNMPYKGPSEISFNLWTSLREIAEGLASTSEIAVGEGRQDAPVGTTVAMMEAANRIQSATIKNSHRAYRREFKLFASLFGEYLPEKPYPYPVAGGNAAIMRSDFSDHIDVIPVSDPNITSSAQRMMRAEALLRFATQAPQLHDQYQAYRQMYVEMGVDERKIDKLLPPPQAAQPLDPLTENQNMLTGKAVAVGLWQDHQAHIISHQPLSDSIPAAQAHIAEHLAAQMRVQVEQLLGVQLPPPGEKLPPEIENKIAVMVAQAMQQLKTPQDGDPTPGQIAMAQIQVEAKKIVAQIAETKAKASMEAYKSTQRLQSDREDRAVRLEIAQKKLQEARIKADSARRNAAGGQRRHF